MMPARSFQLLEAKRRQWYESREEENQMFFCMKSQRQTSVSQQRGQFQESGKTRADRGRTGR